MRKMLLMRDVMTPAPVTIEADQTVDFARSVMEDYNCRHLPVMESGELVGIISDRRMNYALTLMEKRAEDLLIRDVCIDSPYCAEIDDPLDKTLREMVTQHLGAVPVLEEGNLTGIFTSIDAFNAFGEFLASEFSTS